MGEYVSIKEDVLKKLREHLPEIRSRFGIETIGVFGSVARGDDLEDSDVDVLYTFQTGESTLSNLMNLEEYLEALFGRKVDLVARDWISPYIRSSVIAEVILV